MEQDPVSRVACNAAIKTGFVVLINELFDLRPGAIIRDLDLRRPIYRQTAAYGHFGRDDLDLPWERTDRAAEIRRAAGLEEQLPMEPGPAVD